MAKIALEKVVKPLKVVKVVVGSRGIASEENCPLTQVLTLTQLSYPNSNQGQFSLRAIVWILLLLHLGIGSHGNCSVKLFGGHKSCYNGQ